MNNKITYKDSGVNIDEGNAFVSALKPLAQSTFDDNVLGSIGGFAGAYALPSGFKNPVLLSSTDGVGTKLKVAIEARKFNTIGIDLVAMCVNDLICNFATPLFFLDYYATAKLDKSIALEVIQGIVEGCKEAQVALIGGESAEMPSMYQGNDFDLAGFAVGVAERENIERQRVQAGDTLIALHSSGLHSNGYSLARVVLFDKLKMSLQDNMQGENLGDILLRPTRIYVKTFLALQDKIHALAHITGGGILENLPRVLPQNLHACVDKASILNQQNNMLEFAFQNNPDTNVASGVRDSRIMSNGARELFEILSKYVEEREMWRTFNMGVGLVIITHKNDADDILKASGGFVIGEVRNGKRESGIELF